MRPQPKDRDRLIKLVSFILILCPGFSIAVVGRLTALFPSSSSNSIMTGDLLPMAVVIGLGFGILFGVIYAWLDPEVPKCEGKIPTLKMIQSVGWFLLFQVFVAPVLCGITMAFLYDS